MTYITLAPHDGHRVAPAGILAPQFLHVIPIWPTGAAGPIEPMVPIGIDPIGWPGIMPGAIDGLKTRPRIPPIRPRMNPITKPPIAEVAKLTRESIKTMTPHIVCDDGLEYIITPPKIMIIPRTIPTIPSMPTVVPTPVALAPLGVVVPKLAIRDPTNA